MPPDPVVSYPDPFPSMHPPRPSRVGEYALLADDLAEWLLAHCPLSTLSILTLLVIGSTVMITQPIAIIVIAALGDLTISLTRRIRRKRRAQGSPRAAAPRHAPA
jgi:hypothetical protein